MCAVPLKELIHMLMEFKLLKGNIFGQNRLRLLFPFLDLALHHIYLLNKI